MTKQRLAAVCGALALLAGSLGMSGCGDTTYGMVRAVHASSTAPNVDAKAGNTFFAQNLAFGSASTYTKVPSEATETYNFYAAGSDSTSVLNTTGPLLKNTVVTVFALGELSHAIAVAKVEDPVMDAAIPASGDAKVRVVHGSYLAGPVDVYVTAPGTMLTKSVAPVLTNFTFGTVSPYVTVPAGDYEVQVTPTGNQGTVLITVPSVTLSSGQLYTAIAVDPTAAAGSEPSVVLINDPPVPTGTF